LPYFKRFVMIMMTMTCAHRNMYSCLSQNKWVCFWRIYDGLLGKDFCVLFFGNEYQSLSQTLSRLATTIQILAYLMCHSADRASWYILMIIPTTCTNFSNLYLEWNSTCFGQSHCPSSGVFHCKHSKSVWHIPLLCVQRKTADDGQRNCPKHVVFFFPKINLRN